MKAETNIQNVLELPFEELTDVPVMGAIRDAGPTGENYHNSLGQDGVQRTEIYYAVTVKKFT